MPHNLEVTHQEKVLQALFVHGMGRTSLSGWPLLWRLKRAGMKTGTFSYMVSLDDSESIIKRLVSKILTLSTKEDYVLIGHSLGGVLIRAAVNSLPLGTKLPSHIFLLGSPLESVRLVKLLIYNPIYRVLTRDCGQLLGSVDRMSKVLPVSVPTTSIVGVRSLPWKCQRFHDELNDGVLAVSEVSANWITDQVQISTLHSFLPFSKHISEIILDRLNRDS